MALDHGGIGAHPRCRRVRGGGTCLCRSGVRTRVDGRAACPRSRAPAVSRARPPRHRPTRGRWAIGSTRPTRTTHPLIEHHDGAAWAVVPAEEDPTMTQSLLLGVDARTTTDAWAVGYGFGANNLARTLVERWDGMVWTRVESPNAGHPHSGCAERRRGARQPTTSGPSARTPTADPSLTLIEHWDGTAWTIVPSPNKGPFPTRCPPSRPWRPMTSGLSAPGSRRRSTTGR